MKRLVILPFVIFFQAGYADDDIENSADHNTVRITNKENGFQSQVVDTDRKVQLERILRNCSQAPYQIIDPVGISTSKNLKFLDPFTGDTYSPSWMGIEMKQLPSKFPISNFNAYVKTVKKHAGIPLIKATKYEQYLTVDFVKYESVVLSQYGHYIPSLVGFGFRAKIHIKTKISELNASEIIGISSLMALQANTNNEILSIDIQELGISSPTLVNLINQVNSSGSISEKLKALTTYQTQIKTTLSNPDAATEITPVVFSQKKECSKS